MFGSPKPGRMREKRLAGLGLDLGDGDAEDLLCPLLERVVDLRTQLSPDDEVHENGSEDDGERDCTGGADRDPSPERHWRRA